MPTITALDREMLARGIIASGGVLPNPAMCPSVHAYRAALACATPAEFEQVVQDLWVTLNTLRGVRAPGRVIHCEERFTRGTPHTAA